jgi:hypothetical protein
VYAGCQGDDVEDEDEVPPCRKGRRQGRAECQYLSVVVTIVLAPEVEPPAMGYTYGCGRRRLLFPVARFI